MTTSSALRSDHDAAAAAMDEAAARRAEAERRTLAGHEVHTIATALEAAALALGGINEKGLSIARRRQLFGARVSVRNAQAILPPPTRAAG